MSDQLTTLEGCMEALEKKFDACPTPVSAAPVGHKPHYTGDVSVIFHCYQVVKDEIRLGNYKSETLHTHLADAYGEAAVLALTDEAQPVGAVGGGLSWLTLLRMLILLVGEKP